MVCLVEWILGRMKKKKGKPFWRVFGWKRGEGKMMVGPGCFLPKMGRKLDEENLMTK